MLLNQSVVVIIPDEPDTLKCFGPKELYFSDHSKTHTNPLLYTTCSRLFVSCGRIRNFSDNLLLKIHKRYLLSDPDIKNNQDIYALSPEVIGCLLNCRKFPYYRQFLYNILTPPHDFVSINKVFIVRCKAENLRHVNFVHVA